VILVVKEDRFLSGGASNTSSSNLLSSESRQRMVYWGRCNKEQLQKFVRSYKHAPRVKRIRFN